MKSKVTMFDAEGAPVGETFTRRARQLVNQQRAEWINESAIRFSPDAEIDIEADEEEERPAMKKTDSEALLYYLAEKRLKDRAIFIMHSLLFLPGLIFLAILGENMRADLMIGFLIGGWTVPYGIHFVVYVYNWLKNFQPENRERRLEMEVSKLRRAME